MAETRIVDFISLRIIQMIPNNHAPLPGTLMYCSTVTRLHGSWLLRYCLCTQAVQCDFR